MVKKWALTLLILVTAAWAGAAPPRYLLTLYVSNQSFHVNPVDIKVTIDGYEVVRDGFYAGDGHNYVRYRIKINAGRHILRAASRKGAAALKQEFEMPADRWAALCYWNAPPDQANATVKHFTFVVKDKPIQFD